MAKEDFTKLGYHEESGLKNGASHLDDVKSSGHSAS